MTSKAFPPSGTGSLNSFPPACPAKTDFSRVAAAMPHYFTLGRGPGDFARLRRSACLVKLEFDRDDFHIPGS